MRLPASIRLARTCLTILAGFTRTCRTCVPRFIFLTEGRLNFLVFTILVAFTPALAGCAVLGGAGDGVTAARTREVVRVTARSAAATCCSKHVLRARTRTA